MPRPSLPSILLHMTLLSTAPLLAQTSATKERTVSGVATQLFSAPDESSPQAGTLAAGGSATPIAETLGSDGVKWHLVKTKSGLVGWIKQSDSDHSKKLETFFKSLPHENSAVGIPIPNASSSTAQRGSIIIPVQFAGRSAVVSVIFNGTVRGSLILDTGATSTVISQRLASLLSIQPIGAMMGQTVGGLITAPVARLSSVKVGDAEVTELSVIVHDFSRDARIEGLLGMDFLGQFHFGLDTQKKVLILSPR